MAIQYNVTLHDGATNNDGIITSLGYAEINNVIDFASASSWEIQVKVIGGYSSPAYVIGGMDSTCGIFIKFSDNYYRPILIDSNGNYIGGADGSQYKAYSSSSSECILTLKFTGTQYEFYKDGSLSATIKSSTSVKSFNSPLCLGNDYNGGNFDSHVQQIDLNDCYIKVDGANAWSGVSQGYNGIHIQLRRDTLANWTSANPVLYDGEAGLITDQAQYVVGDGSSTFSSLTKHNMDADTTNLANKDLSNLTATGEKHFLNKTQITNCILEAPNGTHTLSGSTLTLKAGLKVLVPNGRNTDGTLNNTEYTIPTDTSFTYTYGLFITKDNIWINASDNSVVRLQGDFTFYVEYYNELASATGSNQYRMAYVRQDNKWYQTTDTGSTWVEMSICPVGNVIVRADNTISDAYINGTARIFTQSDRSEIAGLSAPSIYYVDLTLGASGATYTAPADGWFTIRADGASSYTGVRFVNTADGLCSGWTTGSNGSSAVHANIQAAKGQAVLLEYQDLTTVYWFRFIYAVGSEKEIR